MTWIDELRTIDDLPALFPAEPGEADRRPPFAMASTFGGVVWASSPPSTSASRPSIRATSVSAWKDDPLGQCQFLDGMADAILGVIRAWGPVLPADWLVTCPPQGASEGGLYPAGILGREVATRLDLDYQTCLQRTAGKRWHHPMESIRQEPYVVAVAPPAVALIVDDFISSGTTMRLSREALAARGVPSFGFAWGAD